MHTFSNDCGIVRVSVYTSNAWLVDTSDFGWLTLSTFELVNFLFLFREVSIILYFVKNNFSYQKR